MVFATNVLHATRDMAATLAGCKALLRPGGLLLANELTAKTTFLTLTFGLTDGWWLYSDPMRRIPGAHLLGLGCNLIKLKGKRSASLLQLGHSQTDNRLTIYWEIHTPKTLCRLHVALLRGEWRCFYFII